VTLQLQPITFREACAFIALHHRHHNPPRGQKFAIAVNNGVEVVGVIVVGRPVSPMRARDGYTAEATRCCTDGTPHVASKLYAAAWRAARAMGYRRIGTYTLKSEPGTSLRAAGWVVLYEVKGRSWDRPGRPRVDRHPTEDKLLWEAS
jgi:hypothetical protein